MSNDTDLFPQINFSTIDFGSTKDKSIIWVQIYYRLAEVPIYVG